MGWCYEFGPQIGAHCDHPMTAGKGACTCSECGAVCTGRFAGCDEVWAQAGARESAPPRRPIRLSASGGGDDGGATATVEVIPVEPVAATHDDDGSVRVLEWLRHAFEEVHGEIRELRSTINKVAVANAVDEPAPDGLGPSVAEVRELTDQLRGELARLAAFRRALAHANPEVDVLVNSSAARAEARHGRHHLDEV